MAAKNPNWVFEEIVLVTAIVMQNDWKPIDDKDQRAIQLSELLNKAKFHAITQREPNFRNPTGVSRKSTNIASVHPTWKGAPTNGSKEDVVVVTRFIGEPSEMLAKADAIRVLIEAGISNFEFAEQEIEEEAVASEGRLLWEMHSRRERNVGLRKKKIDSMKVKGLPINCEVCAFNFHAAYGDRGLDYIEVHHKLPLHVSGETKTKLDDLALLCANCHRIIHRGIWIPVEELKRLISVKR